MDFKSTHYGMAFSYKYRDMASLRLSYEGAPQGIDKGYTMWSDRAKSVFNAQLTVSPISALDISLGYELRSGRAIYEVDPTAMTYSSTYYTLHTIGNVNSLNLEPPTASRLSLTCGPMSKTSSTASGRQSMASPPRA